MAIDVLENKNEFLSIARENIKRKGIDSLLNWLETTDFFTAPASTNRHGSEPGGLCDHSLEVYRLLKKKQTTESDETIAVVALFHDLCKANFYEEYLRNVKDTDGNWVQVPSYTYKKYDELPLGHGEKSLVQILWHMRMTPDEMCAVRWHMGFACLEQLFERPSFSLAMNQFPLVLKLQEADQEATFISHK